MKRKRQTAKGEGQVQKGLYCPNTAGSHTALSGYLIPNLKEEPIISSDTTATISAPDLHPFRASSIATKLHHSKVKVDHKGQLPYPRAK